MLIFFKASLDTCIGCPGKTALRDRWRRIGKHVWKNPECHLIVFPALAEPSGGHQHHIVAGRNTPKYTVTHTPLLFQAAFHVREKHHLCLILIQIVVLGKTLNSPLLDCKEIRPVHLKEHQPWILTGRTDAEAETPVFWPPDAKSRLVGKDVGAGEDWGQEEKGTTENEKGGWHHGLNGHEFEQIPAAWRAKSMESQSQTRLRDWTATTKNTHL